MKNFGTLFGYELKKLLKRKLNWAVTLLITGICIVGVVQSGNSGGFWIEDTDEQGNPVTSLISGREIRIAKLNAPYGGELLRHPAGTGTGLLGGQ